MQRVDVVFLHFLVCTFIYIDHYSYCMRANTNMRRKKHIYIYEHIYMYRLSIECLSSSHCDQKQKSACLQGLLKHMSWKIYGRLELNCVGLLLEKDRWGLSRDMFYQFDCVS